MLKGDFKFSLYICLALLWTQYGGAQSLYTIQDSILIYSLLDAADEKDFEGKIEDAFLQVKKALFISQEKQMRRGEGYANLKIADLLLKKSQYENIKFHLNEGLRIGFEIKDSLMMGLAYHQKSQYLRTINEYDNAILALRQALSYYLARTDSFYIAITRNDLGFLLDKKGEYLLSINNYLDALRIFEALGNEKEVSNCLGNVGISYFRLNNKPEAANFFKQSLAIREKIGDIKGISTTLGNLVTLYSSISLDSALIYQQKALEYAERSGIKSNKAQAYSNTATLLNKQNKFSEAFLLQEKAASIYLETGDLNKVASQYIQCANLKDNMSDSIAAERFFEKVYSIAWDQKNKPLLQAYYFNKANFYRRHQNYSKAIENLDLNTTYKDSLIDEKTKTNIEDLKLKYETEKKNLQLAKLSAEQKQSELEIDKQDKLIQIKELLNLKNRQHISLLEKDQDIQEAKLQEMESEKSMQELLNQTNTQQLSISNQSIKILEQEKWIKEKQIQKQKAYTQMFLLALLVAAFIGFLLFNRFQLKKKIAEQTILFNIRNNIAKDLHDEIGSTLTSIHILSHVSKQSFDQAPEQAKEMLGEIATQSKTIQQNMSDIVWAIRPDNEKIEALTARMREFAGKTLEPKNINVVFNVDEEILSKVLPIQARKEVLLIFKEVINNIIKHAEADQVKIQWVHSESNYQLQITDNGVWKGSLGSTGTGMRSMQERALAIGGQLEVLPGQNGTQVNLILPIA
ncbi:MAG: tetratricopeptide repeat protein [Saprospiraceae bacterium]